MINKKYLKLIRSKNKIDQNTFIYNLIAKRIIDSLDLLNVSFDKIFELGINENTVSKYIEQKFNNAEIFQGDLLQINLNQNPNFKFVKIDPNNLRLEKSNYNLIFSNLFLHLSSNIEGNMKNIFNSLKSNGFFIATVPGISNIYQLINSMYETDIHFYNGAYNRYNPTFTVDGIMALLKKNNFDSPSINSDNIKIEYSEFAKLINDIREMKLSYCHNDKKQNFENRNYFNKLAEIYKKKYYDDGYLLDININIISAWKK